MAWTRVVAARLRALWAGDRVRDEIEEEYRFHIESRVEENLERGMSPEEARREAERRFGHMLKIREAGYDVRGGGWIEAFWRDLKFGARLLAKRPGFTAIAVLTLALGIGATTAIFSVVNAVLLRPLGYGEPARLVTILDRGERPVAPANFIDLRASNESFERVAAAEAWGGTLASETPEVLSGLRMGEGLFEMLGVPPLLGRTLEPQDFRPGDDHVVVLSHKLWQRAFGGDPNVVGREILLTGESYTVVGVMPPQFQFPPFWSTRAEIWTPLELSERATNRRASSLRLFGLLKPGVDLDRARTEISLLNRRLVADYPEADAGLDLRVDPLAEKVVGDVRPALLVLTAAVVFVLLIACANVACLLLVRAQARQQETAVRMALGASRGRIVRQLLVESLLLAICGATVGLALAFAGVGWLTSMLAGDSSDFALRFARLGEIRIDGAALAFTFVTAVATSVLFGLVPALATSRSELRSALAEHRRGAPPGGRRVRELLVVGEIALALALMVSAGLLMNSFLRLRAVDAGFDPHDVLTATVSLAGQPGYVGPAREAFYRDVVDEIEAIPGVESASAINHLPIAGDIWGTRVTAEGRPLPPPGQESRATYRVCRPGYFRAMGIPLRAGRDFDDRDAPDAPGVAVVNETFANEHWPGENPIGRRVTRDDLRNSEKPPKWLTVVGVVKDVKQASWTDEPAAEIYLPFRQDASFYASPSDHFASMTLVVRTHVPPESVAAAVRERVRERDRAVPVSRVSSMEQVVADALWESRFNLQLLGLFAGLALVLAALGLYGVLSYAVARRMPEVGLRMALGAHPRDVLKLVVGQGLKLALLGLVVGLLAAVGLSRLMSSMLFEVKATDPATFGAVAFLLLLVALAACWIPARRASRVDPLVAIRNE
jgi:putative ABC transport system permease protein